MDTVGVDAAVVVSACVADDPDNNEYVAGAVASCPGRLYQLVDVDSRWSFTYHRPGAAGRLALTCERLTPAGVSHYLATANDGWLLSAEGRAFFAAASRRGLIVSLAATPSWHADILKVAALFPATPVLLNHLALVMLHPDGVAAALDIVRQGAGPGHDNLIVKVSGYYYGTGTGTGSGSGSPSGYPFADRLEIVRAFYETWGPHRMVWASDYPASAPHITYRQSLEVIREHATFIASPDLPLILGGTMQSLLEIQNLFLS
jgi:L-fuconolactonase